MSTRVPRTRNVDVQRSPDTVKIAHWCAAQGWPVHPLAPLGKTPAANCDACSPRTGRHSPASCPCIRTGAWCHGFHAATLSHERISQWWTGNPTYGVGVSCGPAGLVVIDVDAHVDAVPTRDRILPGVFIHENVDLTGLANGYHTIALLAALRGERSPADDESTLRVRTPSGGMHVWYQAPAGQQWLSSTGSGLKRALAWQVDIRAQGSYIIAPGNRSRVGAYEAVGPVRLPAPLPRWVADELRRTGHAPTAPADAAPRNSGPVNRAAQAVITAGGGRSFAESTMTTVLSDVASCAAQATGTGFSAKLNRAAFTAGGLVAAGFLTEAQAADTLLSAAEAARPGQTTRSAGIIRAGIAAGTRRPLRAGSAR
ncbi:bifunctional DNA primase/polymerase (plasmid) [Streptomycetaceae bacterium NBC_01309]